MAIRRRLCSVWRRAVYKIEKKFMELERLLFFFIVIIIIIMIMIIIIIIMITQVLTDPNNY